ncbi:Deoxyguanosinetriphosphate triphosphohydrolase-like protein [uncultured archaeon]|nr:Deoxyguanosinetriphosphate triphosphohydrolase-like protein [uncultured archaeon]
MPGLSIKDPIHGTIELDELESSIIDTADFQRLRGIRQLATAYLVYPGANHTRFEHSLGTLHLASGICRRLGLEEELARKVRLHALLHDLGHVAFSHEAERVTAKYLGTHEKLGKEKIMKGEVGDIISSAFSKKEIADFASSPHAQIISSDIGADRMDYLKRDAYYTGVAYGVIDEERIMNKMYFENNELGVEEGALEASESLLIARFMMFSTVYLHHTVRIASAMLERSLQAALGQEKLDPKQLLSTGDQQTLALLSKTRKAGEYASALLSRKLYKQVYSLPPSRLAGKDISKTESELSSLAGCGLIIDVAPNFFKLSGFKVKMHSGKKQEMGKMSEMVRALELAEESRKKALVLAPAQCREKAEKICRDYFSG